MVTTQKENRVNNRYYLKPPFEHLYLTEREWQCMKALSPTSSYQSIAKAMRLSPYTVEFYFNNIKVKLGCKTKWELLKKRERVK